MIEKIVKVGTGGSVIIPRDFLKELGLSIGDQVDVQIDRRRKMLYIVPISRKTQALEK